MKKELKHYVSPEADVLEDVVNEAVLEVSGGNIENPGDGGNWDW